MELVADAARLEAEMALDQALNVEHQHQLNAASDAFLFGITEPRIVIGVKRFDFLIHFQLPCFPSNNGSYFQTILTHKGQCYRTYLLLYSLMQKRPRS